MEWRVLNKYELINYSFLILGIKILSLLTKFQISYFSLSCLCVDHAFLNPNS
jgi:hypothetical protein